MVLHVGVDEALRLVPDTIAEGRTIRDAFAEPVYAGVGVLGQWKDLVVVLGVHERRQSKLAQVGLAARLPRFLTRLGEHRKQYRREDRDDCDNDEEFNQSKGGVGCWVLGVGLDG